MCWAKIGKKISDPSMKGFKSYLKEFVHAFVDHGKAKYFKKGMILIVSWNTDSNF